MPLLLLARLQQPQAKFLLKPPRPHWQVPRPTLQTATSLLQLQSTKPHPASHIFLDPLLKMLSILEKLPLSSLPPLPLIQECQKLIKKKHPQVKKHPQPASSRTRNTALLPTPRLQVWLNNCVPPSSASGNMFLNDEPLHYYPQGTRRNSPPSN